MVLRMMYIIFMGIYMCYLCGTDAMTTPSGNRCYTCSFTVNKPYLLRECINNTDEISLREYTRPCEHYCYTAERFNMRTKEVDSVFRSCRDFPKNGCAPEDDFLTCTYSCLGSLCNNRSVGADHEKYCKNNLCSKAVTLKNPFYLLMFVLTCFLIVRRYV